MKNLDDFYKDKKVLVTGHTGFVGSWFSVWLCELGASVIGYGLAPEGENLFDLTKLDKRIINVQGDIKDLKELKKVFDSHHPEIVFHLAAQPIVRKSYNQPQQTFETNMMGTVNVLECIRNSKSVKSVVVFTTDKVYKNKEWVWGYREDDELGGHDPYSASKACAELVTNSYKKSFFAEVGVNIATVRAGNILGGGDWASDRIVPDSIKALSQKKKIIVRNPDSVRPWQHVLEPISGCLLLGKKLSNSKEFSEAWNFGPSSNSILPVKDIVDILVEKWGSGSWYHQNSDEEKHEAGLLSLNIDKANSLLGWKPELSIQETIDWVVDWYKRYKTEDVYNLCSEQINKFISLQ